MADECHAWATLPVPAAIIPWTHGSLWRWGSYSVALGHVSRIFEQSLLVMLDRFTDSLIEAYLGARAGAPVSPFRIPDRRPGASAWRPCPYHHHHHQPSLCPLRVVRRLWVVVLGLDA